MDSQVGPQTKEITEEFKERKVSLTRQPSFNRKYLLGDEKLMVNEFDVNSSRSFINLKGAMNDTTLRHD